MKRRWVVMGPGLLVAIIASLVLWYLTRPDGPPRVERTQVGPAGPAVRTAPDPDFVVGQDPGLTAAQRKRMQSLHARWRRETAELRAAVEAAQRDMAAAASASPVRLQDVQARGAALSDLSRSLSAARRAWWDDASRVLTAEQRLRVENAWEESLRGPGQSP